MTTPIRRTNAALALIGAAMFLFPSVAAAQDPQAAQDPSIVVEGNREQQEQAARDLAKDVVGRLDFGRPLPRFFEPLCLAVAGVSEPFGESFAARIIANAERADVPVAKGDCEPNALVILSRDGRGQLEAASKKYPHLFDSLKKLDIKKLLNARDPAYAWQVTEVRGADGRPFQGAQINGNEVKINNQFQIGRLNQQIRIDVNTAVVLIDSNAISGKTAMQLADYASFRLFATTDEISEEAANNLPTILSLFLTPEQAPPELSEFDLAYLRGLYSMRGNAPGTALYDSTVRAMRNDDGN